MDSVLQGEHIQETSLEILREKFVEIDGQQKVINHINACPSFRKVVVQLIF